MGHREQYPDRKAPWLSVLTSLLSKLERDAGLPFLNALGTSHQRSGSEHSVLDADHPPLGHPRLDSIYPRHLQRPVVGCRTDSSTHCLQPPTPLGVTQNVNRTGNSSRATRAKVLPKRPNRFNLEHQKNHATPLGPRPNGYRRPPISDVLDRDRHYEPPTGRS